MAETRPSSSMTDRIAAMQDFKLYRELHWEGSFEEYLGIVREKPQVTRNAYQRVYDMIISYGTEEYIDNKKKLVRYNFFKDEQNGGANAIFGLDIPLMRLVHVLKAAAEGYGPEKRVILLHGPVGSSKSTIARLLKQGVEQYSRSPDGALYTFDWVDLDGTGIDDPRRRSLPEPDERGAAAPHPAGVARQGDRRARASRTTSSRSASTATSTRRAASSSRR